MEPTYGFVSGRSNDRFTPRVVIHDEPIPWDEYLRRFGTRPTIVSHADQARDEQAAQKKQNETDKKTAQKKKRKRGEWNFSLAPTEREWHEYETGKRLARIHREVKRIQDEIQPVLDVFDTIKKPNAKQRRTMKRILDRAQHAIDRMPSQ